MRWLVSKTTKMLSPTAFVKSIVGFRFSESIIFAPSLFNIDIFEAALSQQIFVTTTPVSFNSFTAIWTRLDKSKYLIVIKNEQFKCQIFFCFYWINVLYTFCIDCTREKMRKGHFKWSINCNHHKAKCMSGRLFIRFTRSKINATNKLSS